MTTDQNLGSLLEDANSTDDLQPQQLSGDQSAQRSLLASDISGTKASTHLSMFIDFLLTVTTIMKTVIGAGILSLPLTVSRLGYVLALIVFVFVICIIQFTAVLLLKAKNLSKHSNYSSISYHIFRTKVAQTICSLMILINNSGICIIELTILKGSLGRIFDGYIKDPDIREAFYFSPYFIVIVCAVLECPFTLVSKIEKLKFLAFMGVSGITVFVITLIITFFAEMNEQMRDWSCHPDMVPVGSDFLQMVIVIPNLMLALAYQMNFFPIFKGMKDARDEKMTKASITGVAACSIFYILVGNMGYCLFGNHLQGNFLLAFRLEDTNEALYLLMNIGFLISVFFSFPVMFFGARNNFIAITKSLILICRNKQGQYRQMSSDNVQQISSYIQTEDKIKRKRQAKIFFIIYTIILFGIIIGISIAVEDIEDVFNVVGAIASNAISFIFPCMFYVFLIRKKNKQKKVKYWIAFVLFLFFIPFGVFSVVSKFLKHKEI